MHLWFLWFLCWLVAAFVIYASIANYLAPERIPNWLVCSSANLLWLVPLTMLPQSFMSSNSFGPDTSVGLLPIPSVLAYYAVFFFFGVVYWDIKDDEGRLGRRWMISVVIAIAIVLPVGLSLVSGGFGFAAVTMNAALKQLAANFSQALFAWLMIFGCIGMFRQMMSQESKSIRYISDSAYWLYLAHLPLILLAQWLVRDYAWPSYLKFAAVITPVTAILLLSYEFGVRYTFIGRILNGPRRRPT
jgi:hypothetical protein